MRIFIFGASIAWGAFDEQGWWRSERLKATYMTGWQKWWKHSVYNLSISGNTTQDLLKRFENELIPRCHSPESLIIFAVWANDSAYHQATWKSAVSLDDFSKNIDLLVDTAKRYVNTIVFLSILDADDTKTIPVSWDDNLCYSNQYIEKYNKAIRNVVENEWVHYLDICNILDVKLDLDDGIHPNRSGHQKIYTKVKKYINDDLWI